MENNVFLVSELMAGPLTALIKSKEQYPLSVRLKWALQTAEGMSWLHQNNPPIIHMDLKPDNILYDKDFRIKVCDFGLSRIKEGQELLRCPVGTPLYMSPEVLGARNATPRVITEKTDVYSFAIVLWEIITRQEAYAHHKTYVEFCKAIIRMNERPPIPADCPRPLANLLERCWTADSDNRPSFVIIIQELKRIIEECEKAEKINLIRSYIKDPQALQFWSSEFVDSLVVVWESFSEALYRNFNLELPDEGKLKSRCNLVNEHGYYFSLSDPSILTDDLKSLLRLKSLLCDCNNNVNIESFGKISDWFHPLVFPHSQGGLLDKIESLLSCECFHGDITADDALNILIHEPAGSYLVRYSKSHHNSLVISVKVGDKIQNNVVLYRDNQYIYDSRRYASLAELLDNEAESFNLVSPIGNSHYSFAVHSEQTPL